MKNKVIYLIIFLGVLFTSIGLYFTYKRFFVKKENKSYKAIIVPKKDYSFKYEIRDGYLFIKIKNISKKDISVDKLNYHAEYNGEVIEKIDFDFLAIRKEFTEVPEEIIKRSEEKEYSFKTLVSDPQPYKFFIEIVTK